MTGYNEQALLEVLERVRYRFYGKYRGTVTDVDAGTLRIKAKVPSVLGTQPTGWCMACVPYAGPNVGMAFLPEVGAGVWIEFEGGDVSYPIWVGCYWRAGEQPSDAAPAVKAIVTVAPHKILLDDNAGSIIISDSNQNSVKLDATGITLTRGSSSIQVSDSEVNVNDGALGGDLMGNLLNTSSILMCPHGGTVTAVTSSERVQAVGSPLVRATDTFLIAGCAFILGLVPHPCVLVQWVQPDALSRADSSFTLSEESLGFCVAADMAVQGAVLILATQPRVSGT